MAIYNVSYCVYEKNSTFIVSEGVMPVNTSSQLLAEQTVMAMFSSAGNCQLRGTQEVR